MDGDKEAAGIWYVYFSQTGCFHQASAARASAHELTGPGPAYPPHHLPQSACPGTHDRETIAAILDEGLVASVGFVDGIGDAATPFVIPMAYVRVGDRLLLHGARASRALAVAAAGAPLCVTVTLLDGLVLARSAFSHSVNYRAVMVFGRAHEVTDEAEKRATLDALVNHVLPGRAAAARAPSNKELAATRVVAVPLDEASAKVRTGGPNDDDEDLLSVACWAGHVPLALRGVLPPVGDTRGPAGSMPLPEGLRAYRRDGLAARR